MNLSRMQLGGRCLDGRQHVLLRLRHSFLLWLLSRAHARGKRANLIDAGKDTCNLFFLLFFLPPHQTHSL